MDSWPTPEPARPEERSDALHLLFQHLPPREADRLRANSLYLMEQRQVDPEGLLVLRGPSGLWAVLLCVPMPGASAAVWAPQTIESGHRAAWSDLLLSHAISWMRQLGVKQAQVLILSEETPDLALLARHGFRHITHLWYLRRDVSTFAEEVSGPGRLRYETFDDAARAEFQRTLMRTYEGTLDCPEVNGLRTAEEILQGHQAQGDYDPERWWLLRHEGQPVGVLLLCELPDNGDWDVAYFGIVPEARRRGFGREAMLRVLDLAQASERRMVGLSVDGRNKPAWELYRGLGFEPAERREIFLALFR